MDDSVPTDLPTNKQIILECALELFSRRGYDAVGVQEIVLAARVTKPTLYHYFTNKRGLLDAIITEDGVALAHVVEMASRYEGDLPLTLEKTAFAIIAYANMHPVFYRLLLSLYFAPVESESYGAVSELLESLQSMLEQVFIHAVVQHGNMRGRHRAYAATFLGTVNTYVGFVLAEQSMMDDEGVRRLVKHFMHGIFS